MRFWKVHSAKRETPRWILTMRCLVSLVIFATCITLHNNGIRAFEVPIHSENEESVHEGIARHTAPTAIERQIEALWTTKVGVDVSSAGGLAALGFPRHGLNETCNNALCEFMETALSCKGLGFHLSKICAQYILGFVYNCPIFPAPGDLFEAPSVCINEIAALLPPSLVSGLVNKKTVSMEKNDSSAEAIDLNSAADSNTDYADAIQGALGASLASSLTFSNVRKYLASDFSQNCQRRCFQSYIEQGNNFYASCSGELVKFVDKASNTNLQYPLPYLLENFQFFRNQVCAENKNGTNCFSTIQQFLPSPDKPKPFVNIFQYDCKWDDDNGFNNLVFENICLNLQPVGCCFGNQVAMLAQSQTNQSAMKDHSLIRMFQPCLLRNLALTCQQYLNPRSFCTKGANGNISTITGSIVMGPTRALRDKVTLVNVYDENDIVFFQGVLSMNLLWNDQSITQTASLQVEILNYAYFNSTIDEQSSATQLTPSSGELYVPYRGDFTDAKSARYDFQITLQGLTQEEADDIYVELTTNQVCSQDGSGILRYLYGEGAKCVNVSSSATLFRAEPFALPPKSRAYRNIMFNIATTTIVVWLGICTMFL